MRPRPPSPHPDHRRGVRALLVTALVALLLGGGTGFIAAADAGDGLRLDAYAAAFGTAEPLLGDRGIYTKQTVPVNDTGRTLYPEEEFALFEWVAHAPIWDTQGTPRAVVGLRFFEDPILPDGIYFDPRASNATWLVDPVAREALAVRTEAEEVTTQPVAGLAGPDREAHETLETAVAFPPTHRPENEPLFCGLLHTLQGPAQDVRDGAALLPRCRLDEWGGPPANATFRPEGLARIGATTTLVLHADPAPSTHAARVGHQFFGPFDAYGWHWQPTRVEMRIWLAADNPYPLRIESTDTERGLTEIYRLTAFERGDTPFAATTGLPEPLPPVEQRPLQPWGPDDGGVGHPYPLSEAFQNARDDPSYPDLRAFLEAHPDAQATKAEHHFGEEGGRRFWTWTFEVWGDRNALTVCTERHEPRSSDLLEPGTATADTHQTCHEDTRGRAEWAEWPARLPTIRSLVGTWQTAFDTQQTPNSYGFSTFCPTQFGNPVDPCAYRFTIGDEKPVVVAEDLSPLAGTREEEGTQQRLVVADDGRLLRYENVRWSVHAKEDAPGGAEMDRTLTPLSSNAPVWMLPQGAPMMGAAVVAAASGILYWLWPTLKSGLFAPLFSRIRRDRALDHPIRNELHAAVTQTPGVHIQELVRRTGHAQGTVRHHLGKLVDAGLLQVKKTNGFACYHADAADATTARHAAVLKSDGAQAVLAAVTAHPGASGGALAAATGLTRQTVSYHLARLVKAGLVVRDRDETGVGYRRPAAEGPVMAD